MPLLRIPDSGFRIQENDEVGTIKAEDLGTALCSSFIVSRLLIPIF
jgi:hypothetical protein